jgi:hypothetical protein
LAVAQVACGTQLRGNQVGLVGVVQVVVRGAVIFPLVQEHQAKETLVALDQQQMLLQAAGAGLVRLVELEQVQQQVVAALGFNLL